MQTIIEGGERANLLIFTDICKIVDQDTTLTDEEKTALKNELTTIYNGAVDEIEQLQKTLANRSEFQGNKNLTTPVVSDSPEVSQWIKDSKDLETQVIQVVEKMANRMLEKSQEKNVRSETINSLAKNAGSIYGLKRYDIIHESSLWMKPQSHQMRFVDSRTGAVVSSRNNIEASGLSRSSSEPRCLDASTAVAPNFFRTSCVNTREGEKPQTRFEGTRSATAVEFDQQDLAKRKKTTQTILQQVLDAHVNQLVNELTPEQLTTQSPENPISVPVMYTSLFSPDILRSLARENPKFQAAASLIRHDISGAPADDERALALESLEACESLHGKILSYEIVDPNTKQARTITVTFDLLYFNIPNNKIYEKLPGFMLDVKELREANQKNWNRLLDRSQNELNVRGQNIKNLLEMMQNDPHVRQAHAIYGMFQMAEQMRNNSVENTLKKGWNRDDPDFAQFQTLSDQLVEMVRELRTDPKLSDEMLQFLDQLEVAKMHSDLHHDTRELFEGGLGKNLLAMDNNRSALASRLIALGHLSKERIHFGCRSGKDRTGLVDIEVKLLFTLGDTLGRIPSFREQERLPCIREWREIMTMESGNVFDVTEATLGSPVGLNTAGSASDPLEKSEISEQLRKEQEAAYKIASRPKTKLPITPGKTSYCQNVQPLTTKERLVSNELQSSEQEFLEIMERITAVLQSSHCEQLLQQLGMSKEDREILKWIVDNINKIKEFSNKVILYAECGNKEALTRLFTQGYEDSGYLQAPLITFQMQSLSSKYPDLFTQIYAIEKILFQQPTSTTQVTRLVDQSWHSKAATPMQRIGRIELLLDQYKLTDARAAVQRGNEIANTILEKTMQLPE